MEHLFDDVIEAVITLHSHLCVSVVGGSSRQKEEDCTF